MTFLEVFRESSGESLKFDSGDIVLISGPRGAGKSTLIHSLFFQGKPHPNLKISNPKFHSSDIFYFSANFSPGHDLPLSVEDILSFLASPYTVAQTEPARRYFKEKQILHKAWQDLDREQKIEVIVFLVAELCPKIVILDDLFESLLSRERSQLFVTLVSKLKKPDTGNPPNLSFKKIELLVLSSSLVKTSDLPAGDGHKIKILTLGSEGALSFASQENGNGRI